VIHPFGARSHSADHVETEVCVVCTVWMEIRTVIDSRRTKLATDLNLCGETTETKPVADVVSMCYRFTSGKMELKRK
jgi:hypothetical protein